MPSNVEIKASVKNLELLMSKAQSLSGSHGERITQRDTFFIVPRGRLKLRDFMDSITKHQQDIPLLSNMKIFSTVQHRNNGHGQLIFYERPDLDGPKLSNYSISATADPTGLATVLSESLGVRGVVMKERQLFMVGQTRIHVDRVEGLGHFLELEVVLTDGQSPVEGEAIAQSLMKELGIQPDALITGAYIDLLLKATSVK
ncbi:uncharacterized protein [Ambystoma mexicanum]|uniref:uncharacterized protein isoform X1 n=1 Tax=Ambystoma mexicanum TaxID=8296 RepID=UPI0037E75A8E